MNLYGDAYADGETFQPPGGLKNKKNEAARGRKGRNTVNTRSSKRQLTDGGVDVYDEDVSGVDHMLSLNGSIDVGERDNKKPSSKGKKNTT